MSFLSRKLFNFTTASVILPRKFVFPSPPPFCSGGNPNPNFMSFKTFSSGHSYFNKFRMFSTSDKDANQTVAGNRFTDEDDMKWWMKYISENDEQARVLSVLKSKLISAVDREDYEDVARLKVAIAELTKNDTVGAVMSDLNKAIEEERFQDAAFLRDHAGTGLVGWWFGNSRDGKDPYCPIIHVSAEYGRYLARSYSPWQLATANDGTPFFEIYVTSNKNGEYKEQVFYLKQKAIPPEDRDSEGPLQDLKLDLRIFQLMPSEKAGHQWFEAIKKMSTAFGKDNTNLKDSSIEKFLNYGDETTEVATTAIYFGFAIGGNGERYSTTIRDPIRVPAMMEKKSCSSFRLTVEDDNVHQKPDAHSDGGYRTMDHAILARVDSIGRGVFRETLGCSDSLVCSRALNQQPLLSGLTIFNRIEMPASSDPFSGLYAASNGYLITEVIQVTSKSGQWHDDVAIGDLTNLESYNYVEALKLTGDADVPAGEAVFRAKVGEKYKLPPGIALEEHFGAVARYKGRGRLTGFENSTWVNVDLLVLSGEHLENGFAIAFLYEGPGYYFLRLCKQLQLPSFKDPTDSYF